MNFVSHFYLDRNHPAGLYTIGAATPDLLSIYNSGLRVKYGHVKKLKESDLIHVNATFLAGLNRHFLADRVFHSSPHFARETAAISKTLKEDFPETEVPRKYFIAHILLELLMDKVLIADHPDLLPAYYEHFSSGLPFHEVRKSTEAIIHHELPNYEAFLKKFLDNEYLYHYKNYEHIIYILRRILRRVGIENCAFLDLPAFMDLLKSLEKHISGMYEIFFEEIRNVGDDF